MVNTQDIIPSYTFKVRVNINRLIWLTEVDLND